MKIKKFKQINENIDNLSNNEVEYLHELTKKLEDKIIDINQTEKLEDKIIKVKDFLEISWDLRNLMEDIDVSLNMYGK
jgi:hypothetical protein